MASTASFFIARQRADAATSQALLSAEVEKQAELSAQMEASRAEQAALQAQLSSAQAQGNTEMAKQQFEIAKSDFAEQKLQIMLDGFSEVGDIFKTIQTTSSLLIGFLMTSMTMPVTTGAHPATKMLLWGLACLGFCTLLHSVFLITVTLTDATKLAYQGVRGIQDVKRAFHGLLERRSEIFWHFVGGFFMFLLVFLALLWVNLDCAIAKDPDWQKEFLVFGTCAAMLGWAIPAYRMLHAFRRSRDMFQIEDTNEGEDAAIGEDAFVVDMGPQSRRKRREQVGPRFVPSFEGIAEQASANAAWNRSDEKEASNRSLNDGSEWEGETESDLSAESPTTPYAIYNNSSFSHSNLRGAPSIVKGSSSRQGSTVDHNESRCMQHAKDESKVQASIQHLTNLRRGKLYEQANDDQSESEADLEESAGMYIKLSGSSSNSIARGYAASKITSRQGSPADSIEYH